ncbi:U9-ctenitoxin-Pr1a-like [Stegodyphus dumicola]|uniref:U9-ctenitoxin-Pr1a-like n=1 Tax=Stegodyphus dumicola TaxID=202533 RepID=UPI0015AD8C32|nr:U9-ctenitoxin-Pr1a-like [Stegodyphus dumicola]
MRTIILVAFFFCMCVAVSQQCSSSADCASDECCSKGILSNPACKKLRQKGEFCLDNIEELNDEGIYRFSCPCASGLKCMAEKKKNENNVVVFVDRCVEA